MSNKSPRILIIDDEDALRAEIVERLVLEGMTVIEAGTGLTGIELARQEHPDLIVCDIMLPDIDGYEILRDLRQDSTTLLIPFIFLSAKADAHAVRFGMNLGADDYLTKPFTFANLLSAIHTRLNQRKNTEIEQLTRFARRLIQYHDTLNHQKATHYLSMIQPILTELTVSAPDEIKRGLETLARRLDRWLLPPTQPTSHLIDRLTECFDAYEQQFSTRIDFQYVDDLPPMPAVTAENAFLIVQEAAFNALRYAQTGAIRVALWHEDLTLRGIVQDQGIGFMLEDKIMQGAGLLEIHQRARALGGEVTIITHTETGTGTLINFSLPLLQEKTQIVTAQQRLIPPPAYATLTEREREIFRLIINGLTNIQIADLLTLSVRTVETHRLNLMRKLGVSNKSDLLIYALKNNLTSVE